MSKYPFHSGVESFSFQPEVKDTCISKKSQPGVNFTSPRCNIPLCFQKKKLLYVITRLRNSYNCLITF